MKCDMHVHSWHSGMFTPPVLRHICRESYSAPEQVYIRLKKVGMDLVTLTDHDSVGGSESLRKHSDFFVSEEVTCRMPSGTIAHIAVFDLTERDHVEIQRRRDDLPRLLAYLTERRLLFSINHMFSSLTGPRRLDDYSWFGAYFPAFEVLNGQMLPFHNRQAGQLAFRQGKICVAGSDSHALPSLGSAYTEVPGARDKGDFLRGVRAGKAVARGQNGGYFKLTRDVFHVAGEMIRERPLKAALAPLAVLVPLATLMTSINEIVFARRWSARAALPQNDSQARLGATSPQFPLGVLAWP
jgi:predicted metal-dependent phosphoesterase TrpH